MEKGKVNFSKEEFENLKCLIARLERADSKEQKKIRAKLRKMGLYWSEIGQGMPYTVENLDKLLNAGVIKIGNHILPAMSSSDKNASKSLPDSRSTTVKDTDDKGRVNSDEYYIIGLCDEVLEEKAVRQATFDFLRGDKGHSLPVDAYYPQKKLVIEYHECQHTESVKLFDNKMTVSGVTRDVQRRIYDERRKTELPKHGIELMVISYKDFGESKKIKRNRDKDLAKVREILKKYISGKGGC